MHQAQGIYVCTCIRQTLKKLVHEPRGHHTPVAVSAHFLQELGVRGGRDVP